MGLRDTLTNILGSAWHVKGNEFITAITPATDGTTEEGKPIIAGTAGALVLGAATSTRVAFHGATAVSQRVGAAQAAVSTQAAAAISAGFGFSTSTQADGVVTLLNEIRAVLVEKGLMKGAS